MIFYHILKIVLPYEFNNHKNLVGRLDTLDQPFNGRSHIEPVPRKHRESNGINKHNKGVRGEYPQVYNNAFSDKSEQG